ncbi:MAG: hypothetical protein K1X53_01955 [Candidatus Sumerlaeaceae bacterium]|nr:hypothetical protein [Candidatus Sumerlaeaceae bacterium]
MEKMKKTGRKQVSKLADTARLEEGLRAELARERARAAALERELVAVRGETESQLSMLSRVLFNALDEDYEAPHFHNPLLDAQNLESPVDGPPSADAARCWLSDPNCERVADMDSLGDRIRFCSQCDAFHQATPDTFSRVGELLNGILHLLRDKHLKFTETQQQLVQSEKLAGLGELAAGLAHEINNPVGIILARLDCVELENAGKIPGELAEDLNVIRRHAERLRRITRSLTSFARRHKVEKRVVAVQTVLRELLEMIDRTMQRGNVVISLSVTDDPMPAFADATMVQQVFMNIILNARDAMPNGGELRISAFRRGEELVLEFQDNGMGMEKSVRDRVFDPFFTTKDERGTGLGLSVSYGIIKDHGGSIEVESEPGAGALFRIVLPMHRQLIQGED